MWYVPHIELSVCTISCRTINYIFYRNPIGGEIEMKPNEVYGIAADCIETTPNAVYGVRSEDIETTPNEVYGLRTIAEQ